MKKYTDEDFEKLLIKVNTLTLSNENLWKAIEKLMDEVYELKQRSD